jgi:hypothetical protein
MSATVSNRQRLLKRLDAIFAAHPELKERHVQDVIEVLENDPMPRHKSEDAPAREALNLRITPEDRERLDAIVAQAPILSRHAVALVGVRLGLARIEADLTLLLSGGEPAKPAKARRS